MYSRLSTSLSPTLAQQLRVVLQQRPPLGQPRPCCHQTFSVQIVPLAVNSVGHSSNQGNLTGKGEKKLRD